MYRTVNNQRKNEEIVMFQAPEPKKDVHFDERSPKLPHTLASYRVRDKKPTWRLARYRMQEEAEKIMPLCKDTAV